MVGVLLLAIAGVSAIGAPGKSGPAGDDAHDQAALRRIEAPPLGLPAVPVPRDDPPTAAKIRLGRKLFFDRRLSFNNTMSCGMCHVPEQGFTNNELATPIGVGGRSLRRNAPTILNAAYAAPLFHDGRETALETQTISPLFAENEMANPSAGWLLARIDSLGDYDGMFERAFGSRASIDRIGMAIASWERTMVSGASRFDRWRYGGEKDALSPLERGGYALFTGRGGCDRCHAVGKESALLTDHQFHDTGIGFRSAEAAGDEATPVPVEIAPEIRVPLARGVLRTVGEPARPDLGRFEITHDPDDRWRFKTPSLRNVALTAPYMHDGSLRTLEDVVRFYDRGGVAHAGLDPMIRPLGLEPDSVRALVAFLVTLTGSDVDSLIDDARSVPVGN
ncbi:MAG: cytochrome-c peroxidase [Hyphomicrobiales bacterium]